jgi:alpha-L-fucosidase
MVKNIIKTIGFALLPLLTSCGGGGESYVKHLVFPEGTSEAEKIRLSAHVVPTKQQLAWQELEMTAFVHFTVNTFTGREWGDGKESPEIFNPSQLDARQWVKALKDGGMKLVILTAKHHDGFCLWPTKTTTHSVASSPWRDGKGDVVKELKEACDEMGLKFGVYLSPWDRNASCYGDYQGYNDFFIEQLTELLTWYGRIDEVWFDGANGEGPNGKKQEYDWQRIYKTISDLQPEAVGAIMGGDVRWVGTETGYGRKSEWSVTPYAPDGLAEGVANNKKMGLEATSADLGSRKLVAQADQLYWFPAEVDVSIRPGWFYHAEQDNQVKSLTKLVDIYFNSVGSNAVLLLNVPPDRRGLIHENDVARLKEFSEYIQTMYSNNISTGAKASGVKNAARSVDGNKNTYTEISTLPATIEYSLGEAKQFDVISIQEYIAKGQRVESFTVEAFIDGQWKEIASSTTIGYKKMLRSHPVTTDKVRLTINDARDGALISEFALYKAPELLTDPVINRDKEGMVTISSESPSTIITFTTDGSEPTAESPVFEKPFLADKGGIIKARSFINNFSQAGSIVTRNFDIAKKNWTIVGCSDFVKGYEAENAIDDDLSNMWHSQWYNPSVKHPHFISVDMGENLTIHGFTYTPRHGNSKSGTVERYDFFVSTDGKNWKAVITNGVFDNMRNSPVYQEVRFSKPVEAHYFKFQSRAGINNEDWISAAEVGVLTR